MSSSSAVATPRWTRRAPPSAWAAIVTIVYRRTKAEMPVRVEELHHALEEGIALMVLRAPREFVSEKSAHVCHAILDVMELGPPDAVGPALAGRHRQDGDDAGRSRHHGARQRVEPDHQGFRARSRDHQVGHDHRPCAAHKKPRSKASILAAMRRGADRRPVRAAGDGQAAAREIVGDIPFSKAEI